MASKTVPTTVAMRPPSSHTVSGAKNTPASVSPPSAEWVAGSWHVTHSTLPMWKGRYGVKITYSPLPTTEDTGKSAFPDLNDLVEYQKTSGGKFSSVNGISRSVTVPELGSGWAFSWRGKGWLMIASSQWEVLGYGTDIAGATPGVENQAKDWIVTYFSKTLFTPAGIDIYCRDPAGVSEECVQGIKAELGGLEDESLKKLAGELFSIPRK